MQDKEKSAISKIKELFSDSATKHDLPYIFEQAAFCSNFESKVQWLAMLQTWIVAPINHQSSPVTRLRFALGLLERNFTWSLNVGKLLRELMSECDSFAAFAYLGLFEEKGFIDQALSLGLEGILPLPRPPHDLGEIIERAFPDREDANWLEQVPDVLILDIVKLINSEGKDLIPQQKMLTDLLSAMRVLAMQIASIGSTPSLWTRLGRPKLEALPFWRLEHCISSLSWKLLQEPNTSLDSVDIEAAMLELQASEEAMNQAFRYLEKHGVNSGLVLRMEHMLRLMRRLTFCLNQLKALRDNEGALYARSFLAELICARYDAQHISQLIRGNVQMLSLRVVEHTGHSGEHYITRNRSEYLAMLKTASGGGVLTVGTMALKYAISRLALPPFIEALFNASNYALSFLTMQALHFTLATKQPSMTAAALASKIRQGQGQNNNLLIAQEIRNIVRSQCAAVLGNIGLAIPTSLLIAFLYYQVFSIGIFEADYAKHSIESLNPIRTLTLLYAAQTGVLLWLSSLLAGWIENWIAYQNLAERLKANSRLKKAFGPNFGESAAGFLTRNISGITGNITLGILLGLIPFLGKVSGLPFDVRHVTLSTAGLIMSAVSLGDKLSLNELVMAGFGILTIGLLNFGVSFYLALSVARFAQGLSPRTFLAIRRRVGQLFKAAPLAFIWPTKATEPPESQHQR